MKKFFAYIGFDAVSTAAEEAKKPRDLTIGIIASLVFATFLYMLVSFILTGNVLILKFSSLPSACCFSMF